MMLPGVCHIGERQKCFVLDFFGNLLYIIYNIYGNLLLISILFYSHINSRFPKNQAIINC
ncbi:MAG: hypothetical protein BWK80_34550 [Desulfobacteraceae bacterium IS3]|nr:MAG: hypothetical protein BWK80_34550 [Desulfobacteraceae bacterium IS3]